jgi:NAD(P)-dependent dehydrogenase (short-subunit alcohol dehydrogenase family)
MPRLENKIAVITGAAQGIGAAIAQRFAQEGATLVLLDIDAPRLEQTAAAIKGSVMTIPADVTDEATVDAAFAGVMAAHGRLDILVNNAGGAQTAKLWDMSADTWDFTIRLNLRSVFLCTRAATRLMIPQRSGAIVCMSSGAREGTPWTAHHAGGSAYAAAKAGIHGFIRNAAMELGEYNVRINAVAPGPIDTERTAASFEAMREPPEFSPHKLVPLRRIGKPTDIADAVLYLASDEAGYVTGVTLPVAGGR